MTLSLPARLLLLTTRREVVMDLLGELAGGDLFHEQNKEN